MRTHHCSIILWQCLFTLVDSRAITFFRPPIPLISLTSHSPSPKFTNYQNLQMPLFFFHSHFCSSWVRLFGKNSWNRQKKLQTKSATLGCSLVVNGCSKERSFQRFIPRFACTKSLGGLTLSDMCDIAFVTQTPRWPSARSVVFSDYCGL